MKMKKKKKRSLTSALLFRYLLLCFVTVNPSYRPSVRYGVLSGVPCLIALHARPAPSVRCK